MLMSAKTIIVNPIPMREPNYYSPPDATSQADMTPNFRCVKAAFNY